MYRSFVQVFCLGALVLACGSKAEPHAPDAAARVLGVDAESHHDAAAPDAGSQLVAAECDAERCEHQGEELAHSLEATDAIPLSVKGGDCARVDIDGVVAGMACTCITSNGWLYIGPKGAGCFARGRAGNCLWDDTEFEPCSVGDPKCVDICRELQDRYTADAAKSFKVEVRASTCRDSVCRHVLQIEDACYTDRSLKSGRRFDCSLSDAEILDTEDTSR